jgi:uncharacterized membrane protein YphA (DoxX/SURF4 family)
MKEKIQIRLEAFLPKVESFFLRPASPRPFAILRIGLASVLIAQSFYMRNDIASYFAFDGFIQGPLADTFNNPDTPQLSWIVDFMKPHGISESSCIFWATRIYFFSLIFLIFGFWTRIAAVIAFLLQWTFTNSGYSSAYGFDMYAHIFLFYLVCIPAGAAYSLDKILGRTQGLPSPSNRVGLRVMQIHMAIAYFTSAFEKAQIPDWWNGELIWSAMNLPEYSQFNMSWMASYPIVPMALGWGTLVIEGLLFIFIWPKQTRMFWVLLATSLHLGISIFLGLELFGLIMCVIVISLFGFSAEPELVIEQITDKRVDQKLAATA